MKLYSGTGQFKVYLQGQAYMIKNSKPLSTQAQDIILSNNVVISSTFDPESGQYAFNLDEPFQLIWTSSTTKLHWGWFTVDRYALQGGQTLSFYAIDLYQHQDEYSKICGTEQEISFIEQHGEYLGSIKLRGDDTWKVV
jgi:hypothetical protein